MIPFVDEPPIQYSPADVWQALSARRLERYGSIDLSGGKASERKIYQALKESSEISFNDMPLSGVIKFFRETYNIQIVIDDKVMRITSKKTSANVVRVYPVGDLVVPIVSGGGGFGGGGGGGGLGGGLGGGQGGGGFGGGGQGGGGIGGGGQGGGGLF